METAWKVTALCLTAALCGTVLRASEMRMAVTIAAVAAVLTMLLHMGEGAAEYLHELVELSQMPQEVFAPLLKTVAIAFTTKIGGALCRDAGESALGAAADMTGAVCTLAVALPLLKSVVVLLRAWI